MVAAGSGFAKFATILSASGEPAGPRENHDHLAAFSTSPSITRVSIHRHTPLFRNLSGMIFPFGYIAWTFDLRQCQLQQICCSVSTPKGADRAGLAFIFHLVSLGSVGRAAELPLSDERIGRHH
jgi:hypothetical protein